MPKFALPLVGGGEVTIGQNVAQGRTTLFYSYRGVHCPLCRKFVNALEGHLEKLDSMGVDVVFLSMNDAEKATKAKEEWGIKSPVAYGMSVEQAVSLGLYLTDGMPSFNEPTVFSEPGMFMLNSDGALRFTDICNAPFVRPDIDGLIFGLEFVFSKNYPIRGTHAA